MLNEEVRHAGREVNGGSGTDRSPVVPRRHRDVIRLGERGHSSGSADAEDGDIRPDHVDQTLAQQSLKYAGIVDAAPNPIGTTVSPDTLRTASRFE